MFEEPGNIGCLGLIIVVILIVFCAKCCSDIQPDSDMKSTADLNSPTMQWKK
jgi:hypothetical protein